MKKENKQPRDVPSPGLEAYITISQKEGLKRTLDTLTAGEIAIAQRQPDLYTIPASAMIIGGTVEQQTWADYLAQMTQGNTEREIRVISLDRLATIAPVIATPEQLTSASWRCVNPHVEGKKLPLQIRRTPKLFTIEPTRTLAPEEMTILTNLYMGKIPPANTRMAKDFSHLCQFLQDPETWMLPFHDTSAVRIPQRLMNADEMRDLYREIRGLQSFSDPCYTYGSPSQSRGYLQPLPPQNRYSSPFNPDGSRLMLYPAEADGSPITTARTIITPVTVATAHHELGGLLHQEYFAEELVTHYGKAPKKEWVRYDDTAFLTHGAELMRRLQDAKPASGSIRLPRI